jgi:hypothetical protein
MHFSPPPGRSRGGTPLGDVARGQNRKNLLLKRALLLAAACAFGPLLIPYGPFFIALHHRFETPLAGLAPVRLTPKTFP